VVADEKWRATRDSLGLAVVVVVRDITRVKEANVCMGEWM